MITVSITINKPLEMVWECFTSPKHIMRWNFAANDWHCPSAINDLVEDGTFTYRMESKNKKFGFNLNGKFTMVDEPDELCYVLEDDRNVEVTFTEIDGDTKLIQRFDAEIENSVELQRNSWQAILDNFKKYTEKQ
ncbi:MAG: hypothetical protein ACJAR8_001636 [Bacteroidia bacterium]|jgi:uncharacterized protein YndB with AHSA1/START domain|tara:strand:+ start:227 stop:631 length:405 start_codon:yes stop_codon:yes gene_type:complete